jgi:hypothetical protein
MTIVQTYHTLIERIKQLLPKERITRLQNMAWLQSGILQSRSVQLNRIANKIPGFVQKLSKVRRLARFLDNDQVCVRPWYRSTAVALLVAAANSGQVIRLLIDATKVGNGHQLLMVSLAYRRRALPLVWTWVRCSRGHSAGWVQAALLRYVHHLMPATAQVVVIGDSEFTPLQSVLADWQWYYVLRQKGSHLVQLSPAADWQRCDTLVTSPGQRRWFTALCLTQQHQHRCNFLALWQRGEQEPWLLATNLPDARQTRRHYTRRMWTEEMFGDFKAHGFDLEASHLQHFLRLSRLTLAVALLYVWVVAFGSYTIKLGRRYLVDRHDRRDLSIFRIGLDMLEWSFGNALSVSIRSIPYFT